MSTTNYKTLFFIKKRKLLKSGKARIYLRITVNNRSAEHSLSQTVLPQFWNAENGRSNDQDPDGEKVNSYLEHIRNMIYNANIYLEDRHESITPESLKEEAFGLKRTYVKLLDYYQDHNDEMSKLAGKEFSKSTWTRHITSRKLVGLYKYKYNKDYINPEGFCRIHQGV